MSVPSNSMISRSPDLRGGPRTDEPSQQRYSSARPPQPSLRSAVKRSQDNATAFLGPQSASSQQQSPTVGPGEAGMAGEIIATAAACARDIEKMARLAPGSVQPEILAWSVQLLQNAPQLASQQQSTALGSNPMGGMAAGAQPQPVPAAAPMQQQMQ